MPIEQYTESLCLQEMKCAIGENDFGFVFPQGDVSSVNKLEKLLKKAGGKPAVCSLSDYSSGTAVRDDGASIGGKAKPEYVITFNKQPNTIIVVECKKTTVKHSSENFDRPKDYAVDGALYYAKFLKEEYNVIAIGVSGTVKDKLKVTAFYWRKGQEAYEELKKARDILYEPENYLRIVSGESVKTAISIEDIQKLALDMHDSLRDLAITERAKPVFIAGILIALKNDDFVRNYPNLTSFNTLLNNLQDAIDSVLKDSDVRKDKIDDIKSHFRIIGRNSKIMEIKLGHYNSLSWYIEELDKKIKPMMDFADSSIDALGIFYHEFVKYSGGDGSGLGIVLTPQHLTEFMCDLAEVHKNSKVVDICCGSGTFLVTAMSKMFKGANDVEITRIRQNALFGVESQDDIYTLAIANMIVRGDGKSNIIFGDCFDKKTIEELKAKNIDVGLINPPYAQKTVELEFIETMLDILTVGGTGVAVVPMSCAVGTKFKDVRERLFKKHTLKAVFSVPDDMFYSNNASINVCVMVWEAHKPHDSANTTFFGYYKDDGFVKAKKLGRIDKFNKWRDFEAEWIRLYREREIKAGASTKKSVKWNDEWLCEAYMETDYKKLKQEDFELSVRKFLSYLVLTAQVNLENQFVIEPVQYELNTQGWKDFYLVDFFDMYAGKYYNSREFSTGNIPLVSTSDSNNGVMYMTDVSSRFEGNCLTIGKIGIATYYQNKPFIASADVTVLKPKFDFNKYAGLFIATVINKEKYRWTYGRQIRLGDCKELVVKLPKNKDGNPDWEYMENYIKALPYSNKI